MFDATQAGELFSHLSGGSQALPTTVCQQGAKPSPFLLLVAKGSYKTQLG